MSAEIEKKLDEIFNKRYRNGNIQPYSCFLSGSKADVDNAPKLYFEGSLEDFCTLFDLLTLIAAKRDTHLLIWREGIGGTTICIFLMDPPCYFRFRVTETYRGRDE